MDINADGHKYCLVAAVTIEINKESSTDLHSYAKEGCSMRSGSAQGSTDHV